MNQKNTSARKKMKARNPRWSTSTKFLHRLRRTARKMTNPNQTGQQETGTIPARRGKEHPAQALVPRTSTTFTQKMIRIISQQTTLYKYSKHQRRHLLADQESKVIPTEDNSQRVILRR